MFWPENIGGVEVPETLNDSGEADPQDKLRGMMIPLKRNTIEESEPINANVEPLMSI